eukprot:2930365-Amphidinium_carterae.1
MLLRSCEWAFGFATSAAQLPRTYIPKKNVSRSWILHVDCIARSESCNKLRALAKGGALTGGAQLPLSEEPLRTVLRDQRHMESLAREEKVVQQANARLSDQQLMEALKEWQARLHALAARVLRQQSQQQTCTNWHESIKRASTTSVLQELHSSSLHSSAAAVALLRN